ncbi:type IV secretion system DNA-binding domain-containing protein [Candidatus Peregrinibacteria bacterium]|nr:type IV secretion system DNA-binding domain-containing protein [Candidatus Peregrinibacteria bacterium]
MTNQVQNDKNINKKMNSILEYFKQIDLQAILEFIKTHPWQIAAGVVAVIIGLPILIDFLRYVRHRLVEKDLIFMQITLPREDSQKDKEKEVEKDFRERIAIMEQLYRSLYEMRELSIHNIIRRFLYNHNFVSFEIVAGEKSVSFYVVVFKEYQSLVEKQITSYYHDADIQIVKPYEINRPGTKVVSYYAYESRPFWFPIKTFKTIENDPLNSMTNVLSKLAEDETAIVQIVIRPRSGKWRKKAEEFGTAMMKGKENKSFLSKIPIVGYLNTLITMIFFGYERAKEGSNAPGADRGDAYVRMLQTKEETAKMIGQKAQQDGFDTVVRLVSSAKNRSRAVEIMNDCIVSLNLFKDPSSNYFQTRRIVPIHAINSPWMMHNFRHRIFRFGEKQSVLVPEELASFFHFPTSRYNYTPIIKWLQYKVLPAPTDLPAEGMLLGYNAYRGVKREVRIMRKDRMRHHYVIGQTGTGKSVFLGWMARQDIKNGEGLCVIDPHGDLIEDILQYVPKERAKDVVIFDPSDQERPMGLNILEAKTPQQRDMASSQATEIFLKLFGDEVFGPRIQHYFRNACLTLMEDEDEGATLIDVPRIFVDDAFMKYKVTKVKNPVVKSFWEHEYASTGERERQEMIPYFSAKFGPFITNTIMRNTIGQTRSAFDFREVMDNGKILLIKLSKGAIGDLNTQLLGLVMVARLQMAAMSRVDLPEEKRKDFYLYVDEFQNFATDSFCSILSEARKYHLGLVMAHQYINQLVVTKFGNTSSQIRDAVFGNVGTMMSFKIGAEDAEYMAKEYAPLLSEQDVIGIANYKAYMKLNIRNSTTRPFSLETIWDEAGKSAKIAEILKQYSRMKYGRKREFVDQEIEARIGISDGG